MKIQHFVTVAEAHQNNAICSYSSAELMRSLDEHQHLADDSYFRQISNTPFAAMKSEWMKCPRCKGKRMQPEVMHTNSNGSDTIWWICENYEECMFPLTMPEHIYRVNQTAFQKQEGFVPLPDILNLPSKFQYLYPVTFADSRPPSRCSSGPNTKANSRNETSDASSSSSSSSGKNCLKADQVKIGMATSSEAAPSTSEQNEVTVERENIDEEVAAAGKKPTTTRVVRRKRYHDTAKSWSSLIEKVASDATTANRIINMEESELFNRMQEFFDDKYFKGTPISYKRPRRRVTYRVDDMESCLRAITDDEWLRAKKRLPQINFETRVVMQTANTAELLKSVGIDLSERRKAVSEKVENVMRGFSAESMAKRQKIEESRKVELNEKKEQQKQQIHQSVSARLLSRKMRRDDEERSLASTPATSCFSEPVKPAPYHPGPVDFHVGNELAPVPDSEQQFEQQNVEENEDFWNFDLNGLYDDYNAQNQPQNSNSAEFDPIEDMLLSLENHEQPGTSDNLNVPVDDELASERERSPGEQDEFSTGFDNFNSESNFDFVQDNFDF